MAFVTLEYVHRFFLGRCKLRNCVGLKTGSIDNSITSSNIPSPFQPARGFLGIPLSY